MTPRLDLVALVIGLIASLVGAFFLIAAFASVDWGVLRILAPILLIGIGVTTLVLAVRRH